MKCSDKSGITISQSFFSKLTLRRRKQWNIRTAFFQRPDYDIHFTSQKSVFRKMDSVLVYKTREWSCCILDVFERPCLFWLNPFLLANQGTNLDQWQIKPASYLYNEVNSAYHCAKISSFDEFLVLKSARAMIM